jgi:hypothetical protein
MLSISYPLHVHAWLYFSAVCQNLIETTSILRILLVQGLIHGAHIIYKHITELQNLLTTISEVCIDLSLYAPPAIYTFAF